MNETGENNVQELFEDEIVDEIVQDVAPLQGKQIKPPLKFESQPIPIGQIDLDEDHSLGALLAEAKVNATAEGFTQAYKMGIQHFWSSQGISGDLSNAESVGAAIAQIILDERKRVLLKVVQRLIPLSALAFLAGILIGMPPERAAMATIPASLIAILGAKE